MFDWCGMRRPITNLSFKKLFMVILVSALVYTGYPSMAAVKNLSNAEKKQIVYSMYENYKRSFLDVSEIRPQKAMELMQTDQVVFVDDRTPKERQVSVLPGAITPEELFAHLPQYEQKTIVSYCTISYRSAKLTRKLSQQGLTAYNLAGGLLAWVLEGGKVYDASGETKRIHVYGKKWNYPPDGYEAVW